MLAAFEVTSLFSCFEFSFHTCVQNQKLIIYLMFFFPLVWGKVICIEKMKDVSCALSMNGMHSCSWM